MFAHVPRSLLMVFAIAFFATTSFAHPGVGIVQARNGSVYFTDLKQVWKIRLDGTTVVAVPNVHTHELCLDSDDCVLGEHMWYETASGKWMHRAWRLDQDGILSDVVPVCED